MIRRVFLLSLITCGVMGLSPMLYAETVAEQLGYPADAKLLIIHADDAGMCHSANVATIDALEKGIVTSASIMVPCPWFPEIADYASQHPKADLGLHLTLTAEWKYYRWKPVAHESKVQGLFDPNGFMFHGVGSVARSAGVEEVKAEVKAQIERALAFGIKPTHLDSHMGTLFARFDYLKATLELAEEYNIPFMLVKPTPQILGRWGTSIFKNPEAKAMVDLFLKRGVPMLDGLYSIQDTPVEEAEEYYRNIIASLKPGVSQLIIHLANDSQEIKAITNSYRQRIADYEIFTSPSMRAFIKEQNVHLIGWSDLYKIWEKRIPIK